MGAWQQWDVTFQKVRVTRQRSDLQQCLSVWSWDPACGQKCEVLAASLFLGFDAAGLFLCFDAAVLFLALMLLVR